jgi:hypothetical protein
MRFRNTVLCLVAVAALVFSACSTGSSSDDDDDDLPDDLPIKTIKWETKDGYYQFYTNDADYYEYSFWKSFTDESSDFESFTGAAKKVSGAPDYGYGFLFCYVDSTNFYRVLITAEGYYSVRKKLNAVWTTLLDWKTSSNLETGLNVDNIISVVRNSTTNKFDISFNGTYTDSFTDSSLSANGIATYVAVGTENDEKFPNTPVDVRIKFTAPNVLPSIVSRSTGSDGSEWAETAAYERGYQP